MYTATRLGRWFYVRVYSYGIDIRLPYIGQAWLDGWSPIGWLRDFRGTGSGLSTWSPWSEVKAKG